jgi:hypothetical protein
MASFQDTTNQAELTMTINQPQVNKLELNSSGQGCMKKHNANALQASTSIMSSVASKVSRIRAQKRPNMFSPARPDPPVVNVVNERERKPNAKLPIAAESQTDFPLAHRAIQATGTVLTTQTDQDNVRRAWSQPERHPSCPSTTDVTHEDKSNNNFTTTSLNEYPAQSSTSRRHITATSAAKLINRKNVKSRQSTPMEEQLDLTGMSSKSPLATPTHGVAAALLSRRREGRQHRDTLGHFSAPDKSNRIVLEPPGTLLNQSEKAEEIARGEEAGTSNTTVSTTQNRPLASRPKLSLKTARRRLGSGFRHSFSSNSSTNNNNNNDNNNSKKNRDAEGVIQETIQEKETQNQDDDIDIVTDLQARNETLETIKAQLERDREQLLLQFQLLRDLGGGLDVWQQAATPKPYELTLKAMLEEDNHSVHTASTESDRSAITVVRSNTTDDNTTTEHDDEECSRAYNSRNKRRFHQNGTESHPYDSSSSFEDSSNSSPCNSNTDLVNFTTSSSECDTPTKSSPTEQRKSPIDRTRRTSLVHHQDPLPSTGLTTTTTTSTTTNATMKDTNLCRSKNEKNESRRSNIFVSECALKQKRIQRFRVARRTELTPLSTNRALAQ